MNKELINLAIYEHLLNDSSLTTSLSVISNTFSSLT